MKRRNFMSGICHWMLVVAYLAAAIAYLGLIFVETTKVSGANTEHPSEAQAAVASPTQVL